MSDRAPAHIMIGGDVSPEQLERLTALIADYDLRTDWSGEFFDPLVLEPDTALDLYGTEIPGVVLETLETIAVTKSSPIGAGAAAVLVPSRPKLSCSRAPAILRITKRASTNIPSLQSKPSSGSARWRHCAPISSTRVFKFLLLWWHGERREPGQLPRRRPDLATRI